MNGFIILELYAGCFHCFNNFRPNMTTCKRNSKDYTTCVDAATEKFQCSKKDGYYEGPCEYRGEGNAILLAVKIIVKL